MILPNNDTFIAYCATKGYPTEYNDGLKVALETDLSESGKSLADLIRLYEATNGSEYLYP